MADWYVSSAAYAGISAFATKTYSVGDFVVPTAPALKAQWVFRCTTAGLSTTEPTWNTSNNGTSTSGAATFTNVTGQSTYFWSAAAGDLPTLLASRFVAGDRLFISSDHSETQTAGTTLGAQSGSTSYTSGQIISVNRAGSTPPVAADVLAGATVAVTANMTFNCVFPLYTYGVTFNCGGNGIFLGGSGDKSQYFDACLLYRSGGVVGNQILTNGYASIILNNTPIKFTNTGDGIRSPAGNLDFTWQNTANALAGGSIPLILFSTSSNTYTMMATLRGVDLSAMTGTLVSNAGSTQPAYVLLDSCRIASGATRYSNASVTLVNDTVELVNCYDGTNILAERYQPAGALTTEFTIVLTGGATDNVGLFSHKMVSNTNVDKFVNTFNSFWLDVNNTLTSGSHTATVEIISSGSLNNDEISLWVEYEGTSGSSLATGANSFIATPLTTPTAVTASTATWASSPSTPVKQKLQVTFSPTTAGRVRGQVRLGKASTTVWINPQLTIV